MSRQIIPKERGQAQGRRARRRNGLAGCAGNECDAVLPACQRAACFAATVLAREGRPVRASMRHRASARYAARAARSADILGVYVYAVGSQSCATRLTLAGSAPLAAAKQAAFAPLAVFVARLGPSASLPLPAPALPSPARRFAPRCFVGRIQPPRLAACSAAHPPNRAAACRSAWRSAPRRASSARGAVRMPLSRPSSPVFGSGASMAAGARTRRRSVR